MCSNSLIFVTFNICLLLLFNSICSANSASFFGSSYVSIPWQSHATNQTELELRFRTAQNDAFMFLIGGSSNYLFVSIEKSQVAVKINFGDGEYYLVSESTKPLNDLQWHRVKLKIHKAISLSVDNQKSIVERLKSSEHQIDLGMGMYLGSQASFKSLFLGNIPPFRGCLEDVTFDGKNILVEYSRNAIFENIDLQKCDEQFTIQTKNSSISFVNPGSYLVFDAKLETENASRIVFDFRTISENSILLFAISENQRRFLAIELVMSRIRVTFGDLRLLESPPEMSLSDAHWHHVEVTLSLEEVTLTLDGKGQRSSLLYTAQPSKFLNLQNIIFKKFFFGGLSPSIKAIALNARLQSALMEPEIALKGCLRSLKMNAQELPLQDASVTSGIAAGKCRWHFLCGSNRISPCTSASECRQTTIKDVVCSCEEKSCVRKDFKHKDIVASSMLVRRCKHESTDALYVFVDGDSGSGILKREHFIKLSSFVSSATPFVLHRPPKHGKFFPSFLSEKNRAEFTLGDVDNGTVGYELKSSVVKSLNKNILKNKDNFIQEDLFVLKATIKSPNNAGKNEPEYSVDCNELLLTIPVLIRGRIKRNITESMSDQPKHMRVPVKITMKMQNRTKKALSLALFRPYLKPSLAVAFDKSSETAAWLFKIAPLNESFGRFERTQKPEYSVREFSEVDLRTGGIRFVHRNGTRIEVNILALSVQDSNTEIEFKLVIEVHSLEMIAVNNTGLQFISQEMAMLITGANLSFGLLGDSAAGELSQSIKYEIVSGPQFGSIQKMRTSEQWINATRFSQRQIDRSKIRYQALFRDSRPIEDPIQLRVTYAKDVLQQTVWFVISFVDQIRIVPIGPSRYRLAEDDHEVQLDSTKLAFQSEPRRSLSTDIVYTLLSIPFCGSLYLVQGKNRQLKLQVSSTFSQKDIEDSKLSYQRSALYSCYNTTNDLFDFEVSIAGSTVTQVATFTLMIEKDFLINELLRVWEGDKITIDQRHLFYKSSFDERILFNITKQPQNGIVQVLDKDLKTVIDSSPQTFDQEVIQDRRLIYLHNDSETESDWFAFLVLNDSGTVLEQGRSKIQVQLKNDNPPTRVAEKPFNIVRNGEKRILAQDLKYEDADLNTSPVNIVYSKYHFSNGVLNFDNGSLVEQFTQQDINDGIVKFRHNGSDTAKALLWVTDGQFYLSGSLEIRASDPFINLVNNTGLKVKMGQNCLISLSNLSIDTNFDLVNKSQMLFEIKVPPKYGFVAVNEKQSGRFTLEELEDEVVEFVNSDKNSEEALFPKNDSFQFVVSYQTENYPEFRSSLYYFSMQIYPESFYDLKMINLNNMTVFESKTIALDAETLLVENYGLKEDKIIYTVYEQPKYGVIHNVRYQNTPRGQIHKTVSGMTTFTQEEINQGYIVYRNTELGLAIGSVYLDRIKLEVTNQVVTLKNITVFIDLIPKSINIVTTNLTVLEGSLVTLGVDNIDVLHPYYRQMIDEFIIIEDAKFGQVCEQPNDVQIKSFTKTQLERHEIYYKHDNSEVERDWFTIVARSNFLDKESFPATIHILISTINDESPKLINNSLITVWQNEQVQITSRDLAAIDADTPPSELLITTFFPNNGYLIDSENNITVAQFTQEDVNLGRIWFVHVGTGNGSFRFSISDGENNAVSGLFLIRVKIKKIDLIVNEKLLIAPGMIQSITKQHLFAQASSPQIDSFTYKIVKAPIYGKLFLESSQDSEPLETFTQSQLERNQVVYKQTRPLQEPLVFDKIIFNIESPNLPRLEQVHFVIEIAVESLKKLLVSNIESLIKVDRLTVEEGKLGVLNSSIIDFSSLYKEGPVESKMHLSMLRSPKHGIILKNGFALHEEQDLIPAIAFKNNSIVYKHDDSDTFQDQVTFNMFLIEEVSFALANFTVPIVIAPINDEYPIVLSRMPVLRALQNMKTLVTNQTLNTRDKDGNSASLIYEIRSNSTSRDSYFSVRGAPVEEFSQADIDQEKVFFSHKNSVPEDLQFWFRVRDHHSIECDTEFRQFQFAEEVEPSHCTLFYQIRIILSQLTLQLVNHTTIELQQGSIEATITRNNLATLSKSASPNFIVYRIREPPMNGYICLKKNDMKILEFTQNQVDTEEIQYIQTNFTAYDEFFVDIVHFETKYNEEPLNGVPVKIQTRPLVKAIKPFLIARPGDYSLLNYEYIDASELALKTESNPTFKITSGPRYGDLKVLTFGTQGERRMDNIVENGFTQEDIIRNRIIYVASPKVHFSPPNEMLIDVIGYELSAPNVQTANGILVVNIFSNSSSTIRDEHGNDFSLLTERVGSKIWVVMISREGLLMVAMMLISLFFVIIIFLFMRRCRKEKLSPSAMKNKGGPVYDPHHNPSHHHPDGHHHHHHHNNNKQNQQILTEYSSPSHGHLEYSVTSRSSSNSGLGTQSIHTNRMPIDSSCENLSGAHLQRNYSSISQDNISPLPPPSLYFINESHFSDDSLWNAVSQPLSSHHPLPLSHNQLSSLHHPSKPLPHPQLSQNHTNLNFKSLIQKHSEDGQNNAANDTPPATRSSGDGTSHSKCSDFETDAFEDLLRNNAIRTLDRNLEKMKQKTFLSRQPPYWI